MRGIWALGLIILGAGALPSCQTATKSSTDISIKPIVIAHRGASGELPEHTLEAYERAIEQGADFIEPDLVMTKDGVLVARHDPWLSDSTDIAEHPEFADRKTTLTDPSGRELSDWFVWDFTADEIATLRATQTRPGRDQSYNGQFAIPTFKSVLALAGRANRDKNPGQTSSLVGVYPELKWPSHHRARGLEIGDAALSVLSEAMSLKDVPEIGCVDEPCVFVEEDAGLVPEVDATCFPNCVFRVRIQSFEDGILRELDAKTDFKLVQLVSPVDAAGTPSYELNDIATYADGVGPFKSLVMDLSTGVSTGYAERAVALGLEVHPWTFRDDDIAPGFDSPEAEINAILDAGATGFFTDFPATGRSIADASD